MASENKKRKMIVQCTSSGKTKGKRHFLIIILRALFGFQFKTAKKLIVGVRHKRKSRNGWGTSAHLLISYGLIGKNRNAKYIN